MKKITSAKALGDDSITSSSIASTSIGAGGIVDPCCLACTSCKLISFDVPSRSLLSHGGELRSGSAFLRRYPLKGAPLAV